MTGRVPLGYIEATGAVGVSFLVRLAVDSLVPGRAPWIFYFPAIAFAAWRNGIGPSAWALLLAALSGWFFWVPPSGTFALKSSTETYLILAFLASGSTLVAFGASNQRTRKRLEDESRTSRRASRELAESVESFQGVFEHAQGDAVILMDAEFVVLAWNPGAEAIFGYASPEMVGRSVDRIFTSEAAVRESTDKARRDARHLGVAVETGWFLRKDGGRFWGNGSLVALHRADGTIRGYVEILRDETARYELENALRAQSESLEAQVQARTADLLAANAELEGFTYSVSHDMRAPLRAIVAHGRILMEDYGEGLPEDARYRVDRMVKASDRMSRLIEDLLTYARLGKQALLKQPTDLASIFWEVVEQEAGDVPVEVHAPDVLPVEAEPGLMRMVLENLVGNALKYRRPDVPLRLDLRLVDHEGQRGYALTDNGIGFEMQYAPKLFEPFERLHRNEVIEGTGIGLANVRRIVARHGGMVWAEGQPGVGSTFGFTLP